MVHLVYCDNAGKIGEREVSATAIVKDVQNYVKLSEDEIDRVFQENEEKLVLTEKQRVRWHKKCICLVEFDQVEQLETTFKFEKQTNMDDWLIIEKIEDVLVGSSIPYNYENSKF